MIKNNEAIISKLYLQFRENSFIGCQLILSSATVPRSLDSILGDYVDVQSFSKLKTRNLHKVLPHVRQDFLRLPTSGRVDKLFEIVKEKSQKKEPVIIFANKTKACNWLWWQFEQNNIPCLRLNKSVSGNERIDQFEKFQQGYCDIICCTDLGSRGLDTTRVSLILFIKRKLCTILKYIKNLQVKHVINFDLPMFVADYIHRAGRTGRVGSPDDCSVTTIVRIARPCLDVLAKLEFALRTNHPIDNVNANIKRLYKKKEQQIEAKHQMRHKH